MYWIAFFKPMGLLNICKGGNCGPDRTGFKHSQETRRQYSEARKGKTPHVNNRIATIARNKRGMSEETKQKIAKHFKGRKLPIGVMEKIKAHPSYAGIISRFQECNAKRSQTVVCVDTGEIFPSINAAARSLGKDSSHFTVNLNHGWRTGGKLYKRQDNICPVQ